jgi:hypothetical protein
MKLAAAILALSLAGCTNHTAAIAHSAIDARQAVGAAIVHMDAAREELDGLQTSIEAVQAHVAYVSDDENPIYATLKYVSVAGVVIGGFAVNEMVTWNFAEAEPGDEDVLKKFSVNPPNVYGFGHQAYYEHVVSAITNNTQHLVDGLAGRKSLELISAIYESIETGKEVSLRFKPSRCRLGHRHG